MMSTEEKRDLYQKLVEKCDGFELKGKKLLYTAANGHMFSQLNSDGELGIRFDKETQQKYMQALNTTHYKSYGAVMKDYVLMPESLWGDLDSLVEYLIESYQYILSLKPK